MAEGPHDRPGPPTIEDLKDIGLTEEDIADFESQDRFQKYRLGYYHYRAAWRRLALVYKTEEIKQQRSLEALRQEKENTSYMKMFRWVVGITWFVTLSSIAALIVYLILSPFSPDRSELAVILIPSLFAILAATVLTIRRQRAKALGFIPTETNSEDES